MTTLYIIYIISAALLILSFGLGIRLMTHHPINQERYIKALVEAMMYQTENYSRKIVATTRRERMALAEAIGTICAHSYDSSRTLTDSIARSNNLTEFLIHRLSLSFGSQQRHILRLLRSLPLNRQQIAPIARILHSRNHTRAVDALLIMLSAEPGRAITTIAELEFELQPHDLARIIKLLRQGIFTIAYEPVIQSDNTNLQRLGIAIIHNFSLDIAQTHLLHIIEGSTLPQIKTEALYTLAGMKCPLRSRAITRHIAQMSASQREELSHHLSVEGYSLQTIRSLIKPPQSLHAERLICSFKRFIVQTKPTA